MKCRRLEKSGNNYNVVWFGSYGVNEDGTAKFYNENNKHDNYSVSQEGVVDSLIQRLNVIKGELWYNVSVGIPLFEKSKKVGIMDSYIITTILDHPDVISILEFKSEILNNHIYNCYFKVATIYGDLDVNLDLKNNFIN